VSRSSPLVALGLVGALALWLGPYAWMTLTSLRPLAEILASPASLPRSPTLGAYREVLASVPLARTLAVTVAVAASIALLQLALALPAGYALAKLRFAGRRAALVLVLACLLLPAQLTFLPSFVLLGKVGLVDGPGALVLPFAFSALGTFLVRQALLSVPDELIEAARLDGASEARIVYGLLGPLVSPTLTALFLFSFVVHYGDYFWPLVMTFDDRYRTLPLAMALLYEPGTGVRWHVVMAGNVVLSAPVLVLFAVAQRHLLRAVSSQRAA
jgi:sn-glycerol 3-phosphate transport system permease protein